MDRIIINNFKSLIEADIRLGKLTVFSGLNGSGKSSVLQVFGMLKQSIFNDNKSELKLKLRGNMINLGRVSDIYSEVANSNSIDFDVYIDNDKITLSADAKNNSDDYLIFSLENSQLNKLRRVFKNVQLIQADRITPGTQYDQASSDNREIRNLGIRGEYTVDYLCNNYNIKVSKSRVFTKDAIGVSTELFKLISPTDSLLDQVCGWMQHVSPGVKISAEDILGTDSVKLKYKYTGESITSDGEERRPTHVGFGLTYCLPIVVAALIAEEDSILIIENPEAHLHPQGQFAMGILLAKCASDGVKVLVETHSDHVLNGMRVAVKNKKINHEDVAIHYFSRGVDTGYTFIQSPNILEDGSMTSWPVGFFDQWSKSLDILLG